MKNFYLILLIPILSLSSIYCSCNGEPPKGNTIILKNSHCIEDLRSKFYLDSIGSNFSKDSLMFYRIKIRKDIISKFFIGLNKNEIIENILLSLYDLIDIGDTNFYKNINKLDDSIKSLSDINFCSEYYINNSEYKLIALLPRNIYHLDNEDKIYKFWLDNIILSCKKKFIKSEKNEEDIKLELFRETLITVLNKYCKITTSIKKIDQYNRIINDLQSGNYFRQSHYELTEGMEYLIDNIVIPHIIDKGSRSIDIVCSAYTDKITVNKILYIGDTMYYPSINICDTSRILQLGVNYKNNYNKIVNNNCIRGEHGNCILSYIRAFKTLKYIKEKIEGNSANSGIKFYYKGNGILSISNELYLNRKFEIIIKNN
jgi:hypothetical protein